MKVVSFNVNSIRQRIHQLAALKESHEPAIIGLQETKVTDVDYPALDISELGYKSYFFGQKTHYGVAILSTMDASAVQYGFPSDDEDAQRRFIHATFEHVLNGYFPQGESDTHPVKYPAKRKYYEDLNRYISAAFTPEDNLIVMGDLNVAFSDSDIGIGDDNAKRWLKTGKCSFLPEEREWFSRLVDWGLIDSFEKIHPGIGNQFSWFDYRSKGFEREPRRGLRIDYVMVSPPLANKVVDAGIDYAIRSMPKPSDHCPVWTEFTDL